MHESMSGLNRTHRCTELSNADIGKKVTVMGWVQKRRNLGALIFVDLRDRTGLLQLIFDSNDLSEADFDKAYSLRSEYVIAAEGVVEKRSGAVNENLRTGDIEVRVSTLKILSDAETPPFPIEENINTREELRLKYRYLDLRRPDLQRNLMLRSQVTNLVRAFLAKEGFIEIETPLLTASSPEGARDYLVPSRIHPGSFYALPQSPQLFKQLLMCAGYDRYMQIARCFRDEDLRADRQPDFTQIDLELSFVTEDDVMDVNERMLAYLFKEVLDVDVKLPILRMPYKEAMERFGSDKPDIRFGMELKDITDIAKNTGFKVFTDAAAIGSVRAINVKGQGHMPRKKIDALVDTAKGYGAKGLVYIAVGCAEDGSHKSGASKFLKTEEMDAIVKRLEGETGDLILIAADTSNIVFSVLGALRLKMGAELGLMDKNEFKFLWVTEFPLLEWSEEENRFMAKHHPFTMPRDEDLPMLETEPGAVRAKAYDIVLNGTEIGGGSIRIHQADVQNRMFAALGISPETAQERFGYLLNAFKYGVPPHGGLAYGLDRLVMLMAGTDNIREVIAFPKAKDASCLMTNAPSRVEQKQLDELGIAIAAEQTKE